MNYNNLKSLISSRSDIVEFANYGDGVSSDWVKKAEKRLGVKFPPSYIWWLEHYNGGHINGEEIFSIYEIDFNSVVGGDIVFINELNRKNKTFKNHQLVIQENDQGESYYFDLSIINDQGESPIFIDIGNIKYASDFIEFLEKKINE